MLGPKPSDIDYVAWQSDQDAYAFSGQKCSAQSMLFIHSDWNKSDIDIVGKLEKLATKRTLDNLTCCPVITWTTEQILEHTENCLNKIH